MMFVVLPAILGCSPKTPVIDVHDFCANTRDVSFSVEEFEERLAKWPANLNDQIITRELRGEFDCVESRV